MLCLRDEQIGSIDFFNLKTFCYHFSSFAYFLKIPNASWLRSFYSAWGIGRKESKDVMVEVW